MLKIKLISILTVFLLPNLVLAEVSRRHAELEWEAIEGAKSYDIELVVVKNFEKKKKYDFTIKTNSWKANMPPGVYKVRMRTRDIRNVPGEWSQESEFKVSLAKAELLVPKKDAQLESTETDKDIVNFKWQSIPGANQYRIQIFDKEDFSKPIIQDTVSSENYQTQLTVAKDYTWTVVGVATEMGVESESPTISDFSVIGAELPQPKIISPENEFVREIKWEKVPLAERYQVTIERNENGKWIIQDRIETIANSIPFKSEWRGGKYRTSVQAITNKRKSSRKDSSEYEVIDGDRTPVAENFANTKRSIDHHKGFYFIARYLIANIEYTGQDSESDTRSTFESTSGIGGIGVGYLTKQSPWGFVGFADLAGFAYNGKKQIFTTSEINLTHTTEFEVSKLRIYLGGMIKQFPQVATQSSETDNLNTSTATGLGFHEAIEYWYAQTPKIGWQGNIHLYQTMIKLLTPNGKDIDPSLSYQFGFMASYRLSQYLTGYAGYARRVDKISYEASSTALNSSNSSIQILGDYLNLIAEYRF